MSALTAEYVLGELGMSAHDVADQLGKFSETAKLLSSQRPRLIDEHPKQWVGLYDGHVEVFGDSLDEIMSAIDERQIPRDSVILRFIDTEEKTLIL